MATVTRRPAPSRPAARAPAPAARRTAAPRNNAMARMEEEQARAEARAAARKSQMGSAHRFFVAPGESREVAVIDEEPTFVRHEHNLKDRDGKWRLFCQCIAENANCPACTEYPDKPAYFALYLTIIDFTPFQTRSGEQVEWSKKLLVVKPTQQKKIMRLCERHGTLRGMVLQMTRDGEKDAAIGNDIEFVEFLDEDTLAGYESEYTDKDNKVHPVIGHEVFDYETMFPEQTEEQIAALVGGRVNNRESQDRAIGRSSRRGSGDDWQETPRRGPPARGTATRRPPREEVAEDDDLEEGQDEGQDDAAADPPARTARPANRPAPRQAAPAPAARRPAPVSARRQAEPEEDPELEGEEEAEPQRPARGASMADRRRALRGR